MPVAFLDLARDCAPLIATETLAAVVSVESGFQPFAIRINSDHPLAEQPGTKAEAIETATILIAEGLDIDLGLGGISSGNLGRLGLTVGDAFDLCLNIKATATLLEGYYQAALEAGAGTAQAETVMLQSYFGNGDVSTGEIAGYDRQILAERKRLSGRLDRIEIAEISQTRTGAGAPVASDSGQEPSQVSPPRWDVFNSGRQSSVLVFSNEQKER